MDGNDGDGPFRSLCLSTPLARNGADSPFRSPPLRSRPGPSRSQKSSPKKQSRIFSHCSGLAV